MSGGQSEPTFIIADDWTIEKSSTIDVDEINRVLAAGSQGSITVEAKLTAEGEAILRHMNDRALLSADYALQRGLWRRGWRTAK
jgi:hypothetical protein